MEIAAESLAQGSHSQEQITAENHSKSTLSSIRVT